VSIDDGGEDARPSGDEGMTRVGVHGRVLCHTAADAALAAKQLLSAEGVA